MAKKLDYYSITGRRQAQEDRLVACQDPRIHGTLVGVFDGHGGEQVSEQAAAITPGLMVKALRRYPRNYQLALQAVFTLLLEEFEEISTVGSTCSLVYIPKTANFAYFGILGDSPVVVIDNRGQLVFGQVHNRHNPEEIRRLEKRGAVVSGSYFENAEGDGIAVSRALGDAEFPFLIRTPQLGKIALGSRSQILVGSDGLFCLRNPDKDLVRLAEQLAWGVTARELVDDAYKQGSSDNITAVIWRA